MPYTSQRPSGESGVRCGTSSSHRPYSSGRNERGDCAWGAAESSARTRRNDRGRGIGRCYAMPRRKIPGMFRTTVAMRTQMMDRRTAIRSGGAALVGLGLAGCGSSGASRAATTARRAPIRLARPRLSWERVIRTTVGLRPHRDGGFVLRADKLDDKVLIHNYGHGGAGMSLAWGCGTLVSELARPADAERIAVIGCGSPGLCTAIQLQRRGYAVTIYAATMPPE